MNKFQAARRLISHGIADIDRTPSNIRSLARMIERACEGGNLAHTKREGAKKVPLQVKWDDVVTWYRWAVAPVPSSTPPVGPLDKLIVDRRDMWMIVVARINNADDSYIDEITAAIRDTIKQERGMS